jgi:hypothetical protein
MSNLKEKPKELAYPSKLSHSVDENTVSLSNYLDRTGTVTQALFGSRRALAYERDEPLPSMFRISPPQADTRSQYHRDDLGNVDDEVADDALSQRDVPNATGSLSPYFAAALFLSLVGAAAVHFTAATPSTDKGAVKPVLKTDGDKAAMADRSVVTTAAFFSAPPAADKAGWQTQSIPLTASSPAETEAWSETVETFKRLIAEQKASKAPEVKQTEAERVLGQLEAWSTAKAR